MEIITKEMANEFIKLKKEIDEIGHQICKEIWKYEWKRDCGTDKFYDIAHGDLAYDESSVNNFYFTIYLHKYGENVNYSIPIEEILGKDITEFVKNKHNENTKKFEERVGAKVTIKAMVEKYGSSILENYV